MSFDPTRLRRLRRTSALRAMVNETALRPTDLIMPIFAGAGGDRREPLAAIPGVNLLAGASLEREADAIVRAGVPAVLVFGVLDEGSKDAAASEALRPGNAVCEAIGRIKNQRPELMVIADLCLCEYTDHRHCGILREGRIDNDATVAVLAEAAVVLARDTVPVPLVGYDVSGFHAMLAHHCGTDAALRRRLTCELLTCIRRAGAKLIITYSAKDIAPHLE